MFFRSLALVALIASSLAQAKCFPKNFRGQPVATNQDGIARFLLASAECPKDVEELRAGLTKVGLHLKTTMVNNRGFHNPQAGSYSFFEMVYGRANFGLGFSEGDVFFGHFTAPTDDGTLVLNQAPERGNLMIELIAWDPAKQYYNFYELIGAGDRGEWFYRGDSQDILHDVRFLHLQANPAKPVFGRTLRCAGCHTNGGPIMKELGAPHNDWWTEARPLPLADWKLATSVKPILDNVTDADELRKQVVAGLNKLAASPTFQEAKQRLTLPEQLRPLFCPVEINLESDAQPLDSAATTISVPSTFFVDPRLAQAKVEVSREDYIAILKKLGSRFPETTRIDGDHAWLSPVKAASDIEAAASLVKAGVIDEDFVAAVLAVDFTNPVTSEARCRLLRLVPPQPTADWRKTFLGTLKQSADAPAAELYANLTTTNALSQQRRAAAYLHELAGKLASADQLESAVSTLFQRRREVFASEISKNPLGQILEPGFRVIFPRVP